MLSFYGADRDRDRALSETREFFRLFMVPGMGHCTGGPGSNRLDPLTALERWVADDVAPGWQGATREQIGHV